MAYGKVLCLLLAFFVVGAVQQRPRTELLIRAVDESGAPVRLTRADIYFDIWGGGQVTPVPHSPSSVRLGLDRGVACALEPALCANHPVLSARILLEAEGLAPISSDLFEWMTDTGPSIERQAVAIRFGGGATLRVRAGTRRQVTLTFRKKQPRTLRVVDRQGNPLPDARVTVRNLHADTNHMGVFEGDEILKNQPTDARGELMIPDGDIVYGIDIVKPHWEMVRPASRSWPNQFYQRIAGPLLTVVMRRHARVPLLLRFQRDGAAAAGVDVRACVVPCGGACCGPLGATDKAGNLSIRDFYPEEYDRVFVTTSGDDYKAVWEIDPRKPRAGRILVNLPR